MLLLSRLSNILNLKQPCICLLLSQWYWYVLPGSWVLLDRLVALSTFQPQEGLPEDLISICIFFGYKAMISLIYQGEGK